MQHMRALQKADEVRKRRAQIKRDLKAGHVGIMDVLDDPAVARMPVADLLGFAPWCERADRGTGRLMHRATAAPRRLLNDADVSGTRLCGDLTERERRALTLALLRAGRPTSILDPVGATA